MVACPTRAQPQLDHWWKDEFEHWNDVEQMETADNQNERRRPFGAWLPHSSSGVAHGLGSGDDEMAWWWWTEDWAMAGDSKRRNVKGCFDEIGLLVIVGPIYFRRGRPKCWCVNMLESLCKRYRSIEKHIRVCIFCGQHDTHLPLKEATYSIIVNVWNRVCYCIMVCMSCSLASKSSKKIATEIERRVRDSSG